MYKISVEANHGARIREPIYFSVPLKTDKDLWKAEMADGTPVLCQKVKDQSSDQVSTFVATVSFDGSTTLELLHPWEGQVPEGIEVTEGSEPDSFGVIDTGWFEAEMCSGTAEGDGSSKWGLRHFKGKYDGVDLLPSGNNAIGGFYGPFFTPENGLINPPEHCTVKIDVIESGPVLLHLRMKGEIPAGLLPELKDKSFTIDWKFTYGTPWFYRRYAVDAFQTVINGRSITNKITVGDEFESGAGDLVFDRFDMDGHSRYREGDPYAGALAEMVDKTVAEEKPGRSEKFDKFKSLLTDDIESAHWDLYWRLFCKWEGALPDHELIEKLKSVREESHVAADLPDRSWIIADGPVDVQRVPHETIFPGAAQKTVEYDSKTGRSMIWWTSKPSGQFQIVQRRQSGWGNWGTNGENECPELPVGVDIKTAYGQFAPFWKTVADQLEDAPVVTVS